MRFVFHPAVKRQRHVTKTIQKLKRPVTKTIKGQKLKRPVTKTIQSQKSKRLAFKTILGPKAKCQTVLFLPRPNGAVLSDTGRKVKWPFLLFLDLTIYRITVTIASNLSPTRWGKWWQSQIEDHLLLSDQVLGTFIQTLLSDQVIVLVLYFLSALWLKY